MSVTYSMDTDIEQRVGNYILKRWTGADEGGNYDAEIVTFHRQRSFDVINAKLSDRYARFLPFQGADIPAVLRSIEIDVTVYALASTYEQAGEAYFQSYRDALKLLDDLAFGRMALMSAGQNIAEQVLNSEGLAMSTTLTQTPIFSRATLQDQMRRRW